MCGGLLFTGLHQQQCKRMQLISSGNDWSRRPLILFNNIGSLLVYSNTTYNNDLSALSNQWAVKPMLYHKQTYCHSDIHIPFELNKQSFYFLGVKCKISVKYYVNCTTVIQWRIFRNASTRVSQKFKIRETIKRRIFGSSLKLYQVHV